MVHRDPTEFRKRFQAWKDGKDVYEAGRPIELSRFEGGKDKVDWQRWDNAKLTSYFIPYIKEKEIKLSNAGRATGAILSTNVLDSIADNAVRAGLPVRTAMGIAVKESTLGNPTDDRTAWNLSSGIRNVFNGVYPGTAQHINYWGDGLSERKDLINYHKGIQTDDESSKGKSVLQEAFEFYRQHPDKYNTHLKDYQQAVDRRANELYGSPEFLGWLKERIDRQEQRVKSGEILKHYVKPVRYRGGKDLQELPEGFLFDTQMPELTVYGDVERAKRQNNWLIRRGLFPRFFSLGNGKGVQEIKTPTEKGLEIVSPEFYALAALRPGGDIIAPITKNQIKNIGRAAIKQATKHPSITPEVTHFYHGSPVKFDTFSADFIGSGEGGSKVMQGINLWPTEKIANAPKFANIKSPDAPLHLGVSSTPLGGELNPTVYDVSGRGLKLYTASPREVKGLSQSDLISQGYDGIQTANQVTVFPESIGKLSIDKQSTIEEFICAHPEVERWTPWTIDNQKMQNIINLSRMSKRTASYKQYRGGKDGQNWLTSAILGASIAEDPAIATAAGWLLTNNGVAQRPNLSTRQLGEALTELSFFSPTNPVNAATTGLLNLGGKAIRTFRPASTKSLTLPTKVDVEPLSNIDNLTETDFKNWIQGKEVDALKDLVPEYLYPTTKDVPIDVIEAILNSITPRLIKMRPFLNPQEVENSVLNAVTRKYNEYPVEAYLRAGEGSTLGIHVPSTDFISIRQGSANKSLQHELRHSLYDLYNPALAEEKLMDRAYNHLFPKKIETWTTNGDARKLLIGPEANRNMPIPQLNRLIDAASKKLVVKAVHDSNAYGARYIDNLIKEYGEVPDRIVNAIKRAMKYVAVGNAVTPVVKNKSKK